MKTFALALTLAALTNVESFSSSFSPAKSRSSLTVSYAYVPDGFTPESYKKFKAQEAAKKKKNLGKLGPNGFQSRSMQSFQEALERGEAAHLMPMFDAKEKLKKGLIRKEDIPYMQRGGNWDNTDVKGARNVKKWLKSDKKYAAGGFKKEQSVSILGYGEGLDWTGKSKRSGPAVITAKAPEFKKNYKAPNVNDFKNKNDGQPKKKMFGLF